MGRGAGEVGAAAAARGQDGVGSAEAVDRAVFEVHGDDAFAFSVFHDEIEGEVFDEVVGVVSQGLSVQRVQHGMPGTVGHGAAAMSLPAFAVLQALPTESALIDLAL